MSLIKTTTTLIIFCLWITTLAYAQTAEDYFNSGVEKFNTGNNKTAISDLDKAIELNPKFIKAYLLRGTSKWGIGDLNGAMEDYDRAIQYNPQSIMAYGVRGNYKGLLGDHKGAILDFNKAIEIDPKRANSYTGRAAAKLVLKDYNGSIQDYNKALELDPNNALIYGGRGVAKLNLKDYKGALEDCDKSLVLNDTDSDIYGCRGAAKIALGKIEDGCMDLRKSKELGNAVVDILIKEKCNLSEESTTVKLENKYYSILNQWVKNGGQLDKVQKDVIETCGKLVISTASTFEKIKLNTTEREEFDYRTDMCSQMTVNRIYPQEVFKDEKIVKMICDDSKVILFKKLCSISGLR